MSDSQLAPCHPASHSHAPPTHAPWNEQFASPQHGTPHGSPQMQAAPAHWSLRRQRCGHAYSGAWVARYENSQSRQGSAGQATPPVAPPGAGCVVAVLAFWKQSTVWVAPSVPCSTVTWRTRFWSSPEHEVL